jgi:transforming growth factor-beta-induced protein
MRSYSWRGLLAASLGLFAAGTNAQTGTLTDLGTLLAGQKNLTTFYALIQVCCTSQWF